jgi:hypothetical protein
MIGADLRLISLPGFLSICQTPMKGSSVAMEDILAELGVG